jgi:hypothetical protein
MSKAQNIWEVVNLNDLVKILKENEKKFVIIGLCLENSEIDIKKSVKKFLKSYSKIYPNITFLYYNVSVKDLGRISLITKNVEEYPFIYHIYDVSNIFVSVNRANKTTMYESMNAVEEYYKKDLQNVQIKQNPILNNNDLNNDNDVNDNNLNDDNLNDDNMKNLDYDNNKVVEHQQLLDKLVIYEEMRKKHNINFLADIQQRKKDEMKRK